MEHKCGCGHNHCEPPQEPKQFDYVAEEKANAEKAKSLFWGFVILLLALALAVAFALS